MINMYISSWKEEVRRIPLLLRLLDALISNIGIKKSRKWGESGGMSICDAFIGNRGTPQSERRLRIINLAGILHSKTHSLQDKRIQSYVRLGRAPTGAFALCQREYQPSLKFVQLGDVHFMSRVFKANASGPILSARVSKCLVGGRFGDPSSLLSLDHVRPLASNLGDLSAEAALSSSLKSLSPWASFIIDLPVVQGGIMDLHARCNNNDQEPPGHSALPLPRRYGPMDEIAPRLASAQLFPISPSCQKIAVDSTMGISHLVSPFSVCSLNCDYCYEHYYYCCDPDEFFACLS